MTFFNLSAEVEVFEAIERKCGKDEFWFSSNDNQVFYINVYNLNRELERFFSENFNIQFTMTWKRCEYYEFDLVNGFCLILSILFEQIQSEDVSLRALLLDLKKNKYLFPSQFVFHTCENK